MRKKISFSFMLILIIMLVSACGDADKDFEDEAIEVGNSFLEKLYNEDDTDFDVEDLNVINDLKKEYDDYLTVEELDELMTTRFLLIPKEIAANQNLTVEIENIAWTSGETDEAEMDFEHEFTLIFTDESGETVEEKDVNGQMTITETNDGPKISRYHDSGVPEELLFPEE